MRGSLKRATRGSEHRAFLRTAGVGRSHIARFSISGGLPDNMERSKSILFGALSQWPRGTSAKYLLICGGFVQATWPLVTFDHSANDITDTAALTSEAVALSSRLMTDRIVEPVSDKIQYIAFGIDFEERQSRGRRAEVAVIYDLKMRRAYVTGKSLLRSGQRRTVQFGIDTHCMHIDGERILVLVCHDLNLFHPRAFASQGEELRRFRASAIETIARHRP